MRIRLPLIMILLISIMPDAGAGDLTGYLAGEVRVFANDPLHEGQKRDNMSIVLKPEYYDVDRYIMMCYIPKKIFISRKGTIFRFSFLIVWKPNFSNKAISSV